MAVAAAQPSLRKDGDQIVELVQDRLKVFAARNAWYELLESYYNGPHFLPPGAPSVKAMNSQGRPQLRDGEFGGSLDKPRNYSSQRLSAIVDDFAALKGRMPITRAEPPTPDDDGLQRAEKLTKYLYSAYELSKLEMQQPHSGWLLSLLGDAVYLLEPGIADDDKDRVLWTVVHPGSCLPSFRRGHLKFELFDLAVTEVWTPQDLLDTWGVQVRADAPDTERMVTTYLSPYQRTVVVGAERWKIVRHADWDLGFCPAQWVFNKPGNQMGQSDIGQALDQQNLLDFAASVWADGIVHMTYPIVAVKNPTSTGQDGAVIGPGAPPVELGPDGDLKVMTAGGDPQAIVHLIQQTLSDIDAATGSSQVRQTGQMHSSIQTGRGIQASQGPQSTRIEAFHESFGAAWRELNAKTLKMQEKAPALSNWEGDIYGRMKGRTFHEQMSAKDIDGWYRTTVTWEANIGLNPAQRLQIAAEGKQFGLWDTPYAMEQVGVEDPIGMHKRVLAEKEHEMQMAGGQQGAPAPGGGRHQGMTPGKGGLAGPSASRPPMIARPFHMGQAQPQAVPGGVPVGTSRKAVQAALMQVAGTLKGEVYALGDLASAGQSEQVTLAITSAADHRKVVEAVRPVGGNIKVRHVSKDKLPPDAVKLA